MGQISKTEPYLFIKQIIWPDTYELFKKQVRSGQACDDWLNGLNKPFMVKWLQDRFGCNHVNLTQLLNRLKQVR